MKTLLRSVFVASPTDSRAALMDNFRLFDASGLGFDVPEYNTIWTFIRDFVLQHRHVPEVGTVRAYFEATGDNTTVDKLEEVSSLKPRIQGDFEAHLKNRAEERRAKLVSTILREAADILQTGMEVKVGDDKQILKGPHHALRYVMEKSHDIVAPAVGSRLSGEVTQDGQDFLAQYTKIKNDPDAGIGQFPGLDQLDNATGGAKRHELWVHAAFTGHLKSSFALNWVYNQAVWYGNSSLYVSLEMPYKQVRNLLFAMHSGHVKFKDIHPPISYDLLKEGKLDAKAEWFLWNHVVPDFEKGTRLEEQDGKLVDSGKPYGKIHIEVADPDKIDFTVQDVRMMAETLYSRSPFRMMVIDHALLLSARRWVSSATDRMNEVIRDCKKMAMSFNRGEGMAVVLLYQINRQGYTAALKTHSGGSNHVYTLTSLAQANECERSADIVTATFITPELAKQGGADSGRVLFQCLKTRDSKPFDPFLAEVQWRNRQLIPCLEVLAEDASKAGQSIDEKLTDLEK